MAKKAKPAAKDKQTAPYKHPEAKNLMRPEVGTQAQFRKKKPPKTYRYDSSLSPALDWEGQNPAREQGEQQLAVISSQLSELRKKLADTDNQQLTTENCPADNRQLTTEHLNKADEALAQLKSLSKPFLNWAGKAERLSFDVPTLPLFIHERLSTKAIIETLGGHKIDQQQSMFDLFGDPQRSITDQVLKAYEYQDNWTNRMVLGDSLVVMNSLLHYEGLGGQVQMIYMDPPYGVKFGSNFQPFVRKRDVSHNDDEDMTREPEMVQAYRDTWELGLHSYLTYLRDRLLLARDLLTPSGSIFVQISDENLHHVREVMDEVFGAENACRVISVEKTSGQSSQLPAAVCDFLLWYAKDKERAKVNRTYVPRDPFENPYERYVCVETADRRIIDLSVAQKLRQEPIPEGRILKLMDLSSQTGSETSRFQIQYGGKTFVPSGSRGWSTNIRGIEVLKKAGRLHIQGNNLWWKSYRDEFPFREVNTHWSDAKSNAFGGARIYVVQTNPTVVQRCLLMTTDPGDLILDPTCGSGTTAYVAEQWGRRWITIDTSRVPLALARQRLLTATFPWYELKDNARGPAGGFTYKRKQNKKGEEIGGIVPHITLKSIANNEPPAEEVLVDRPEVESGITRVTGPFCVEATIPTSTPWEEGDGSQLLVAGSQLPVTDNQQLETDNFFDRMLEVLRKSPVLRLEGNKTVTLKTIRPPAKTLSLSAEALIELPVASSQLSERGEDEKALQGSARLAEGHRVGLRGVSGDQRISQGGDIRTHEPNQAGGDFRAEQHRRGAREADEGRVPSVSRASEGFVAGSGNSPRDRAEPELSASSASGASPSAGSRSGAPPQRTAGVSSPPTTGNQQLTTVPVAFVFGPENGAVSEKLVYEAAREAHAKSYTQLYVIGFAIQPNARTLVDKCAEVMGVPATYVQATPDLMMGDLLKNMRSSQIFSVCGQPEIRVTVVGSRSSVVSSQLSVASKSNRSTENRQPATENLSAGNRQLVTENLYQVELLGLDVFDPITMEVDHRSGDDVPAWFLDTDYNDLCFHVSQAFFPRTSAWDNLKKALKGEYEESVWDHLSGTTSAPFEAGEHKQIAVKVIDDRGNELLVVRKLGAV